MAEPEKSLLDAEQLGLLTRRVGNISAQLPEYVDAKRAAAVVKGADDLLAALGDLFITDDLVDLRHATRRDPSREEVIRNWEELLAVRCLVIPLVGRLYNLAYSLRALAPPIGSRYLPEGTVQHMARILQHEALRLEVEYRWLEQQLCPGIDKALRESSPGS